MCCNVQDNRYQEHFFSVIFIVQLVIKISESFAPVKGVQIFKIAVLCAAAVHIIFIPDQLFNCKAFISYRNTIIIRFAWSNKYLVIISFKLSELLEKFINIKFWTQNIQLVQSIKNEKIIVIFYLQITRSEYSLYQFFDRSVFKVFKKTYTSPQRFYMYLLRRDIKQPVSISNNVFTGCISYDLRAKAALADSG